MLQLAPFLAALILADTARPSDGCEAHLGKGDTAIEVLPGQFICGHRGITYESLDTLKEEARKRGRHDFFDSLLLDLNPDFREKILIEGYWHYGRIMIENGKLTVWNRFLDKRYPMDSPRNRTVLPLPQEAFRTLDSLAALVPGGAFGPDYMMSETFIFCVRNTKQLWKAGGIVTTGKPWEPLGRFWKVLDPLLRPYEDRREPDADEMDALGIKKKDPRELNGPRFDSSRTRSQGKSRKRPASGSPGRK
jgi:hypothetical protein